MSKYWNQQNKFAWLIGWLNSSDSVNQLNIFPSHTLLPIATNISDRLLSWTRIKSLGISLQTKSKIIHMHPIYLHGHPPSPIMKWARFKVKFLTHTHKVLLRGGKWKKINQEVSEPEVLQIWSLAIQKQGKLQEILYQYHLFSCT